LPCQALKKETNRKTNAELLAKSEKKNKTLLKKRRLENKGGRFLPVYIPLFYGLFFLVLCLSFFCFCFANRKRALVF